MSLMARQKYWGVNLLKYIIGHFSFYIYFQVLEAAKKCFSQIYLFIYIKFLEMYLNFVTFTQKM